jgi:hypothetical protein
MDQYLEDGTLINYSINEDAIKNYKASIDGFNITNTLTYKEAPKVVNLSNNGPVLENPQTGDNITTSLVIITISITGLIINTIYLKRKSFMRKLLRSS